MLQTITTHRVFPGATTAQLYNLYTDAAQHAAVTGAPATIVDREGEGFNVAGGYCLGENLHLEAGHLIIQKWRMADWPAEAVDSILILRFVQDGDDAHLFMTHADLPAEAAAGLLAGWDEWYWNKWQAHLAPQTV